MKKKMLLMGVLVSFGLLGGGSVVEASHVQVPNVNLQNFLGRKLLETYTPEEEQDPETEMNLYGGVPQYLFDQEFDAFSTEVSAMDYISASLEGLQHLKTKSLTVTSQAYDLTPLANIDELEELNLTLAGGGGYGGYGKTGPNDLSFMRYRLNNLKKFTYQQQDYYKISDALTDISELSEHPNLQVLDIQTKGGMKSVTMKQGYRKYEVFEPVVLSEQFEGATLTYSSPDTTFSNVDGLLKWNAVPVDTEYLTLEWTITKDSFHYEGEAQIPIVWK